MGGLREHQDLRKKKRIGAGNEVRTRDLNLGKVALYQLSYSRVATPIVDVPESTSTLSVPAFGLEGREEGTKIKHHRPQR